MAQPRATGPYVWVTWLPRLLSGESSCEWASWFKAQHEGWSWSRMPSDFDQAGWLMNHTSLLNQQRQKWEQQGYTVLHRRAEQLQPPGQQRRAGRQARPGRPA